MPPQSPDAPRRRGFVTAFKDYVAGLVGTTRAKVDDFSAEVEHRAFRLLWMIVWTVVGATSLALAIAFAMLTVIFGFGLPLKYAFGIPAIAFAVVALSAIVMFHRARRRH